MKEVYGNRNLDKALRYLRKLKNKRPNQIVDINIDDIAYSFFYQRFKFLCR